MICQLDRLRRCDSRPSRIWEALDKLPVALDGTYERTLLDIDEESWEKALRLFQCILVARRPLYVGELADFLAFTSDKEGNLTFDRGWPLENRRDTVVSTCSGLCSVVDVYGSQAIQFAHYSVQEYLTSTRIHVSKSVSRYHISLQPAHAFVTHACLSILLQLDHHVTRVSFVEQVEEFPLARYAGHHWTEHVEFVDVESPGTPTEGLIERLFNPETQDHHLLNWARIENSPETSPHDEKGLIYPNTFLTSYAPLYYAARHGFCRVTEWLITTHSQDVNVSSHHGWTPIHIASRLGQSKVAQVLLSHHADVNVYDDIYWTPLHHASWFEYPEFTEVLLKSGARVNIKNRSGETPLCLISGSYHGNLETARLLLEYGADPGVRCHKGRDSLYMALREGHQGLIQLLLKRGASPNARDDSGRTLLQIAVQNREEVGLIQLLLKHGADPNTRDVDGQTLLHVSSRHGHPEAAKVLLELGLDVNSCDNRGRTPIQLALEMEEYGFPTEAMDIAQLFLMHGADLNTQGNDGQTLLRAFARHGRQEAAERLLELGVDVNSRDNRGQAPLQKALERSGRYIREDADLVQMLLKHGADPNTEVYNYDDQNPLHLSCRHELLEATERLPEFGLEFGPDVNSQYENETPLQIALNNTSGGYLTSVDVDIMLLLLKHGANPNIRDWRGRTPLHLSCESYGDLKVTERLLKLGVDIDSRDSEGLTPLQIALENDNEGVVELLLQCGAQRT